MGLVSILDNELLMNGTPQDLFPSQVDLKHYTTKIFFDELVSDDEIIIRVFDLDKFSAVEKQYRKTIIRGLQESPGTIINWIPSGSFRVSCQQISGTNKTITFELLSS
ncbi:MAG: hypothetical protein O6761_07770 [Thaumarchaeota archaeon]|nr:hypothetical protein [Nitrososphaerota archaeon]